MELREGAPPQLVLETRFSDTNLGRALRKWRTDGRGTGLQITMKGSKTNYSSLATHNMVDTAPMPDHVPKVEEIGSTSAPLLSASFFIGDRCRSFNDDYMLCKTEANGKGEFECMKEGRKVTRCAASVLQDITTNCLEEFRAHWHCLENNNHQLWQCRRPERKLNKCVFDKVGLKKELPGILEGEVPVHERKKQIFATLPQDDDEDHWLLRPHGDLLKELNLRNQLRVEFQKMRKEQAKGAS